MSIEPIQVEGVRITKIDARNEAYGAGRKTRVFVNIEDETPLENFKARIAQYYLGTPPRLSPRDIRKHILQRVVQELREKYPQAGIKDTSQLHFSRRAGCSACPCSPGYVVENSNDWSIYVEVAPAEAAPGS